MALIRCPECGKEISDKAYSCPHCGYPVKEKKEYVLSVENAYSGSDGFVSFLKVCGVICVIGGLIISILGAIQNVGFGSKFSFSTFLSLFSPFILNAVVFLGLASVVNKINGIYGMIRGIKLDTTQEMEDTKNGKVTKSESNSIPKSPDDWKCPACGAYNSKEMWLCTNCKKGR